MNFYVLETDTHYYCYEEKRHEKFYDSTYPGLNYVVKNANFKKSSLQMWFRIEVEHNLYAGFAPFDTKAIHNFEKHLLKYLMK